jgi:hypothetical protein
VLACPYSVQLRFEWAESEPDALHPALICCCLSAPVLFTTVRILPQAGLALRRMTVNVAAAIRLSSDDGALWLKIAYGAK